MKLSRILTTSSVIAVAFVGAETVRGAGHAQPAAPAAPSAARQGAQAAAAPQPQSGQQPQATQSPAQQSPAQQSPAQQPAADGSSAKSAAPTGNQAKRDKSTRDRSQRNANSNYVNQYPYGYPYGYGQPVAGVYYQDGSSPSGTAGNPNGVLQNNGNGNNNAGANAQNNVAGDSAPDAPRPAMAPVAPAAPAPPDPEVVQATADVETAMGRLRAELLKTDPEYQAAVADKRSAQAASAAVHDDTGAQPEVRLTAATKVLDASARVTRIERDAAASDPAVQAAQSKLKTAAAMHASNVAATAAAPK